MTSFPIYLFIFLVFLNRYVFGFYLDDRQRRKKLDETIEGYEPTITVVVPLFNEGKSIYDTIVSLVKLDYPQDKLEVTVVDDCSTDDSYEWACKAARAVPERHACCATRSTWASARASTTPCASRRAEIIVSVDSDVIVLPDRAARAGRAVRVARRSRRSAGAIHVSNPNENWLTRLQTIKYYFGQEHLKNLERGLRLGAVPVGLPDRVSPPRADRARADPREPQHPRRPDQVRRGPLPHPPDRQARLSHAS